MFLSTSQPLYLATSLRLYPSTPLHLYISLLLTPRAGGRGTGARRGAENEDDATAPTALIMGRAAPLLDESRDDASGGMSI